MLLLVVHSCGHRAHPTSKSCHDSSGALPGGIVELTKLERGTSLVLLSVSHTKFALCLDLNSDDERLTRTSEAVGPRDFLAPELGSGPPRWICVYR
jgi:hypothetical protein